MKSRKLLQTGMIFILISLIGCEIEVPDPNPVTIVKGIVEDKVSGQPVSGAKVNLVIREHGFLTLGKEISALVITTTNSNGEYERELSYSYFAGDNRRSLRVHKDGYLDEESLRHIMLYETNIIDFKITKK